MVRTRRLAVPAALLSVLVGAPLALGSTASAAGVRQSGAVAVSRGGVAGSLTPPTVTWVLTTGDRTRLLAPQAPTSFGPDLSTYYSWSRIDVDDGRRFQTVQGVGAAMTESSAVLLDGLPPAQRSQVLASLFSRTSGAGLSVLRTPLGASDFAVSDYTFDDMPWGACDPALSAFTVARDRAHLLPLVAAAHAINPGLTVVATAWSAPAWMKTNLNTHDGQLATASEGVYAQYLAKAVAAYRAAGAPVSAVTVSNEPTVSRGWSPSMPMTAAQQAELVGVHLRPALDAAGLAGVKILGFDDDWSNTSYPTSLLTGPYASAFAGSPSTATPVTSPRSRWWPQRRPASRCGPPSAAAGPGPRTSRPTCGGTRTTC